MNSIDIPWRLKYDRREDGYIFSTIESLDGYYGKYETAIRLEGDNTWKIARGYDTHEEALEGHKRYLAMSKEEIDNINWIG